MTRRAGRPAVATAALAVEAGVDPAGLPAEVAQALASAARLREAGRTAEAEVLYLRVLQAVPEQPEALHWLGVFQQIRGQKQSALELLSWAAALRSDPLYLYHLGEVQRALGRFPEAVGSYRRACRLAPRVADIRFGLGTALLELGRADEAAAELRLAIRFAPDDAQAHNNLANALSALGETAAAIGHYRRALQLQPRFAEAGLNLGLALDGPEHDEEAVAALRSATESGPGLERAWIALVRRLLGAERLEEALEAARQAVELHPRSSEAHALLGQSLFRQGLVDQALEAYMTAVGLSPGSAKAHLNVGVCLQSLGRFAEAAAAHERALALRPDLAAAHLNLAMIGRRSAAASRVTQLRALLSRPGLADEDRSDALFALGKALEAGGDFDGAFEQYRLGNDIKARRLGFDPRRHEDFVDRLIAVFDEDFFAARRAMGEPSQAPVFILGMPRSGTSLVEQILASHPQVHGAGELDDMRRLVGTLPQLLGTADPFPECAHVLEGELARRLARDHLERLRRCTPPGALRVTDKLTGNYLRLGLIAMLVPNATVVHCRRDPLDTCLSCYLQSFARGLSFTYDLAHLGFVYRQYLRLMAHWRRVLPLRMLDLCYEELVADQERQSRRLVEFCGLPWDERCLAFHRQAREVRTASFWQVRQPLYASSVGRWRAYARHLGPLFEALGDLAAP